MKTRINLYQEKYQPKLTLLSLNSTVFFNAFLLVFFLLVFAFLSWRQAGFNDENKELGNKVVSLQNEVDALQAALQERKPDPALVAMIENQKLAISQRQRLLEELSKREQGKENRFSVVLNDLNTADTPNIWLTKIHLHNESVKLGGYGSTADAMPKWLAKLSDTESFKGMAFEQAVMQRDDTAIAFELNTQLSESTLNVGSQ